MKRLSKGPQKYDLVIPGGPSMLTIIKGTILIVKATKTTTTTTKHHNHHDQYDWWLEEFLNLIPFTAIKSKKLQKNILDDWTKNLPKYEINAWK